MTSFKILFGRDPPTIIPYSIRDDTPFDVHVQLVQRDQLLTQLKHNLSHVQSRMKLNADKKRFEVTFNVGDFVFVK